MSGTSETRQARRMADIEPFHVMDLLARARAMQAAGRDVVHMEVGEPDFDTPAPVVEAGIRALREGRTHYTPALGLPELRRAVSDYYATDYGLHIDPARIVITPGASGALQLATGVLVDRDDEVLMADPGYPCNRHFVRLAEGRAVPVPVAANSAYQLSAAHLERQVGARTRVILLASPSNPTGTLVSAHELQALVSVAKRHGLTLLVDEIYHGLVYGEPASSVLSFTDQAFVVNSFSKYFGMTGWRLGWLVAPEAHVDAVDRLAQNLFLAAPTPSQYAALACFLPETRAIYEQRRQEFQRRRDFLMPALRELGFGIPVEPEGAFYIYADAGRFTDDSYAFCMQLLESEAVAVTPGRDFGQNQAARHLRFAYTTGLERLREGVARLGRFLNRAG